MSVGERVEGNATRPSLTSRSNHTRPSLQNVNRTFVNHIYSDYAIEVVSQQFKIVEQCWHSLAKL